ncbi:hypothetical protein GCM10028798_13050 [Humibacter antri]
MSAAASGSGGSRRDDTPETDARELAENLRVAIGRLVRSVRAQSTGRPRAHAEALAQLDAEGAQTIAQLATRRGVRHQGMSRAIAELERNGLVSRASNPADGRGFVISLTESGRVALERGRDVRRDLLAHAITERLDDDERELLRRVPDLLRKITS